MRSLWRHETTWLFALTAAASLPMWVVATPPGLDWSQHVTLIDIIARLLQGDPILAHHHRIAVQAVGYHLLYGVTVPVAVFTGAATALKLCMTAVLFAHVGLLHWAVQRANTRVPALFALVGIPAFYNAHFVWGFVATLIATPFALITTFGLSDDAAEWNASRRAPWVVGGSSCMACVGHIVFLPFLLLASLLALATDGARHKRVAVACVVGASIPAIPACVARGLALYRATPGHHVTTVYASPLWGWRRLWSAACSFDHRDAMAGWILLWVLLLGLGLSVWRRATPAFRHVKDATLLPLLVVVAFALQYLVPLETEGPLGSSFLLNIRAMCLVPFLVALYAARSPWWAHQQVRLAVRCLLLCSCVLTVVGVTRLGLRYNVEVADWLEKSSVLPPHARLGVQVEAVHVHREWPPLRQSLAATAFSRRLALTNGIFLNEHLPVHDRHPGFFGQFNAKMMELGTLLRAKEADVARIETLWRDADAFFYQATTFDPDDPDQQAPPDRAVTLASGRHWILWGPPHSLGVPLSEEVASP